MIGLADFTVTIHFLYQCEYDTVTTLGESCKVLITGVQGGFRAGPKAKLGGTFQVDIMVGLKQLHGAFTFSVFVSPFTFSSSIKCFAFGVLCTNDAGSAEASGWRMGDKCSGARPCGVQMLS